MGFKENLAFFKKVMLKNIVMWNQNWFTSDKALDCKNYDNEFSWIVIPTLITTLAGRFLLHMTLHSSLK